MTTACAQQVDLAATPYHHCVNRYVRRAFLCGEDSHSGKNFDHHKQWLVDQLAKLAYIFAVDICAYAVMSNHDHVVLRIKDSSAHQHYRTINRTNEIAKNYSAYKK